MLLASKSTACSYVTCRHTCGRQLRLHSCSRRHSKSVVRALPDMHMHSDGWALLLSTLAGLSTSIGGALAVTRQPDDSMLAFLLGSAIGVMATVSVVELWVRNAMHHHPFWVTTAVLIGAVGFAILDPLLPKPPEQGELQLLHGSDLESSDTEPLMQTQREGQLTKVVARPTRTQAALGGSVKGGSPVSGSGSMFAATNAALSPGTSSAGGPIGSSPSTGAATGGSSSSSSMAGSSSCPQHQGATAVDRGGSTSGGLATGSNGVGLSWPPSRSKPMSGPWAKPLGSSSSGGLTSHQQAGLMRLGLVMALTMTLHNLPEGFAVAFSAKAADNTGVLMAVAIALHNIPEGVVVAAPIYAATNSRLRALGAATASGLSEPLGAAVALLLFKPFRLASPQRLDYLLAGVGGVMLGVCCVELWPEARKCNQDARLLQGIALGSAVMAWTLWIGV